MRIPGNQFSQGIPQKRQIKPSHLSILPAANHTSRSAIPKGPKPMNQPRPTTVAQPKTVVRNTVVKTTPKAPPVYKPLLVPKVLQAKSAVETRPQARPTPVAPPVYLPRQSPVLQPKQAVPRPNQQANRRTTPPVFRTPKSPGVLQAKTEPIHTPAGRTGKGVIQMAKHIYQGTKGRIDEIEVNTNKAPDLITLNGKTDRKVEGKLNYRRYGDGTISVRTITTFPHGYGLGAILLYHLGEKALKRNCRAIVVGGPAGTELGFYFRLGATTTKTDATDPTTFDFLHDQGERQFAWKTISIDSAEKEWDSSYFSGAIDKKFGGLDEGLKEVLIRSKRESGKPSANESVIDTYLTNLAAYKTSPDGVIFKDIRDLMNKCLESINKSWEKITRYPGREYLPALLDL